MRSSRRSRSYPLVGVLLASLAPVGLFTSRALAAGSSPTLAGALKAIRIEPLIHVYFFLWTAVVLAVLGHLLGRWFDRAQRLAMTDPLTGLYNRRRFEEMLARELERSARLDRPTCLLCVDLDHFKQLNDESGHPAGDQALVSVSGSLSRNVRGTDVVARIGGDEFALILPKTSAVEALALAQRILADVAYHSKALQTDLTASIGIAEWDPRAELDIPAFLAAADAALYRSKTAGGGRVSLSRMSVGAPPQPRLTPMHQGRMGSVTMLPIAGRRESVRGR